MRISFLPQLNDDTLVLERTAPDRLRINGELFNFGPLQDGDVLPSVPCEWIVGPVTREDGEVRLTLRIPYQVSRMNVQDPPAITVTEDGPITLPQIDPIEEEPDNVDA